LILAPLLIVSMLPTPAAGPRPFPASAGPSISVSPSHGLPGTNVTVSGSGFTPGGYDGTLKWDGEIRARFGIPDGGAFSIPFTIPFEAELGRHAILVCANCGEGEFEQSGTAVFRVDSPIRSASPIPPSLEPMPVPPTPTEPPTACSSLAAGADTILLDFELPAIGASPDEIEVRFLNSLHVVDPGVRPHSGSQAGMSTVTEFGSSGDPIRMTFPRGAQAVGMYLGMEGAVYTSGTVTARLRAFGYLPGASDVGPLGSATTTFAAGIQPIRQCISYGATEGAIITQAELDYEDEAGHSIFEARLIDDMVLLPTALDLPPDLPPEVVITSPLHGHVFDGGQIHLRASIEEDVLLESVTWSLEWGDVGSTGGRLAVTPGGSPTDFDAAMDFDVERTLVPGLPNTFIVRARDHSGNIGEDRVTVQYVPPVTFDIELKGIEATQAVQCLNRPDCEGVPLMSGRATLVRAYLRADTPAPVSDVTGELCYWTPGETPGECIHRVEALHPVTVENVADPVTQHRGDITRTLNFMLPREATARTGTLYIQITANPDHVIEESDYENNDLGPAWINIVPAKRLDVVFIPVAYADQVADDDTRYRIADYLLRVYPVATVHMWRVEGGAALYLDPISASAAEMFGGSFFGTLLYQLAWINTWTDDPVDWLRYYGMVPESIIVPGGPGGMARLPGDEGAGLVPARTPEPEGAVEILPTLLGPGYLSSLHVAAEEIGHNHGRRHATACNGAANPDPGYPKPEGKMDDWGTDVGAILSCLAMLGPSTTCNQFLYAEDIAHDYMTYCKSDTDAWTSLHTYRAMMSAVQSVAMAPGGGGLARSAAAEEKVEALVAGGVLQEGRAVILRGFTRISVPAAQIEQQPSGPYTASLLAADGSVLVERAFGPMEIGEAEPGESGFFHLLLPWLDGGQAVSITREGEELALVNASGAAPTVRLISPNGGERWGASGEQTVQWESMDEDGDTLTTIVQVSIDDGLMWRAVHLGGAETEWTVDLSALTGSDRARVRVVVSDGFHTASDDSDAAFHVDPKPPEIVLLQPRDGAVFRHGYPIPLQALAEDREDAEVAGGETIGWASDRDGELGRGASLWPQGLSAGWHTITASVTDADGMTDSQSVRIVIRNPDGSLPEEPVPPAAPNRWPAILAGAGVAAAVGAALVLAGGLAWLRTRRRRGRA
jgi:hypothetical protein